MKFRYSYILLLVFLSVAAHAETSSLSEEDILFEKVYNDPGNIKPKARKSHPKVRHGNNESNHVIIQLSVAYIQNNLSNKITMEDLTKITGYSERSLQLVFKKEFNQSPFQYIEEQRLLKAKALIEKHKRSKKISAIAQDVGFFHLGRFSVNFKQRFGISPSLLAED